MSGAEQLATDGLDDGLGYRLPTAHTVIHTGPGPARAPADAQARALGAGGAGGGGSGRSDRSVSRSSLIVDVWQHNLVQELAVISELLQSYPYVAMDTEFPGVVARPVGSFKNSSEYHYHTVKCNCDQLKLIQLGISLFDGQGNQPRPSTWQFNMKFNLSQDMYAEDSISLLQNAGIDFKDHETLGIDPLDFGTELLISGLVLSDSVKWVSFHSGYDFGYLLRVLTCNELPKDEAEFHELLGLFFPCIYDIKYMMLSCEALTGGLNQLASDLGVVREGTEHQAGSDSLLTGGAFFKMRVRFFEDEIDDEKYAGVLFGLGASVRRRSEKSNSGSAAAGNTSD